MNRKVKDEVIAYGQQILDKRQAEIERLTAALHHIAYQLPVSDVGLDWHEEWRNLRHEAVLALKGKTEVARKPKKVEFHFDERSLVTDDGVVTEYLSDLRKYTQAVDVMREFESNMLKMAGEIVQLRARIKELEQEVYSTQQVCNIALTANDIHMETIAKTDPMQRKYVDGIPVLECVWCGATRQRFEIEAKHADDCMWVLARKEADNHDSQT